MKWEWFFHYDRYSIPENRLLGSGNCMIELDGNVMDWNILKKVQDTIAKDLFNDANGILIDNFILMCQVR